MRRVNGKTLLHYPLIAVVYALFFTVQLFFNLDTPRDTIGKDAARVAVVKAAPHTISVHPSANGGSHTKKIRLNKRFQPSDATVIAALQWDAGYYYIEEPVLGSYISPYFSSRIFTVHTQRGPPSAS